MEDGSRPLILLACTMYQPMAMEYQETAAFLTKFLPTLAAALVWRGQKDIILPLVGSLVIQEERLR